MTRGWGWGIDGRKRGAADVPVCEASEKLVLCPAPQALCLIGKPLRGLADGDVCRSCICVCRCCYLADGDICRSDPARGLASGFVVEFQPALELVLMEGVEALQIGADAGVIEVGELFAG